LTQKAYVKKKKKIYGPCVLAHFLERKLVIESSPGEECSRNTQCHSMFWEKQVLFSCPSR